MTKGLGERLILDGRNRYLACRGLGIDPETAQYDGDDPVGFVVSLNLQRRHLDESQRAMVAGRIANLGEGRPSQTALIQAVSQSDAANRLNVSRFSVQRAKVVLDTGNPEIIAAVDRGDLAVSLAANTLRRARQGRAADNQRRRAQSR